MKPFAVLFITSTCLFIADGATADDVIQVPQSTAAICRDLGQITYWAATAHLEKADERHLSEAVADAAKPNKIRPAVPRGWVEAARLAGSTSHGNAGAGLTLLDAARADAIAGALGVYEMCLDGRLRGEQPAGWSQVARSVEATIFVDKSATKPTTNGATVWTLTNFNASEVLEGKTYRSAKTQFEFDCPADRYRVLATIFYEGSGGTGKVASTTSLVEAWNPVAPKTLAQRLKAVACAR